MHIPKRYGVSKVDNCPFCGKICVTKNNQGVPVCQSHKDNELRDLKCACGGWLDLNTGKWGPYFRCANCGNINFKKGLEMNPQIKNVQQKSNERSNEEHKKSAPKEITVTSDQLDFLY